MPRKQISTSGSQAPEPPLDDKSLAFDYVTGVLRGAERDQFQQRLRSDTALQAEVSFWEEELMSLSDKHQGITPDAEVWRGIEARLQQQTPTADKQPSRFAWLWPSVSALATLMLAVCLWLLVARDPLQQPNADYVAVLTNDSGAPQLTVLTATGGAQLWLKWEAIEIADEKNLQLWAVSKRDGQIRPLGVFAQTDIQQLPLTVPQWRLIKDSSHLILTEEDVGGSPLDEPSEVVLAKGVCVLLAQVKKAI
jgi:anti-sigma-K factor RskA